MLPAEGRLSVLFSLIIPVISTGGDVPWVMLVGANKPGLNLAQHIV